MYFRIGDMVFKEGESSYPGSGTGTPSYSRSPGYRPSNQPKAARFFCGLCDNEEVAGSGSLESGAVDYRTSVYEHYKKHHKKAKNDFHPDKAYSQPYYVRTVA
jgi:hypothetical protein